MKREFLGTAFLSDTFKREISGKIAINGLISVFWAWDFPCSRSCQIVVNAFNIPQKTSVTAYLKKNRVSKLHSLAIVDIESENTLTKVTTFNIPCSLIFLNEGHYEILLKIKDSTKSIKVPFLVLKKEWAKFSSKELTFLKKNTNIPHSLTANIKCDKCSHVYVFEENIIDENVSAGAEKFPEEGIFECNDCGNIININDLRGQLRESIKDILLKSMRR